MNPFCDLVEFVEVFPELAASALAVNNLQSGSIPQSMMALDKILIDEVQDLTFAEASVLVELLLAIQKKTYRLPAIYLAGDEGQTVSPSGFNWSWLKRLFYKRIGQPLEFEHSEHLRTSQRISHVLNNSSYLYRVVERGGRPSGQRHDAVVNENLGSVFYVRVETLDEASILVREMLQDVSLQVVVSSKESLAGLDSDIRDRILTSSAVKGLEYEKVVVLNPGKALSRVAENTLITAGGGSLAGHINRTEIDTLRVLISRATDVLVFLDVSPDPHSVLLSMTLLGEHAVELLPGDVLSIVVNHDILPADNVRIRLQEVSHLMSVNRSVGWMRLLQCLYLCDDTYDDVQREINVAILRYGGIFLLEGLPLGFDEEHVAQIIRYASGHLDVPGCADFFEELVRWAELQDSPLPMLIKACAFEDEFALVNDVLFSVRESIFASIISAANDVRQSVFFQDNLEGWFQAINFTEDIEDTSNLLRMEASYTLFAAGQSESARRVLNLLPRDLIEAKAQGGSGVVGLSMNLCSCMNFWE